MLADKADLPVLKEAAGPVDRVLVSLPSAYEDPGAMPAEEEEQETAIATPNRPGASTSSRGRANRLL